MFKFVLSIFGVLFWISIGTQAQELNCEDAFAVTSSNPFQRSGLPTSEAATESILQIQLGSSAEAFAPFTTVDGLVSGLFDIRLGDFNYTFAVRNLIKGRLAKLLSTDDPFNVSWDNLTAEQKHGVLQLSFEATNQDLMTDSKIQGLIVRPETAGWFRGLKLSSASVHHMFTGPLKSSHGIEIRVGGGALSSPSELAKAGWGLQRVLGVSSRNLAIQATAPFPREQFMSRPLLRSLQMAYLQSKANLVALMESILAGGLSGTSREFGVVPRSGIDSSVIFDLFRKNLSLFSGKADTYRTVKTKNFFDRGTVGYLGPDVFPSKNGERWAQVFWLDEKDQKNPEFLLALDKLHAQMLQPWDEAISYSQLREWAGLETMLAYYLILEKNEGRVDIPSEQIQDFSSASEKLWISYRSEISDSTFAALNPQKPELNRQGFNRYLKNLKGRLTGLGEGAHLLFYDWGHHPLFTGESRRRAKVEMRLLQERILRLLIQRDKEGRLIDKNSAMSSTQPLSEAQAQEADTRARNILNAALQAFITESQLIQLLTKTP